MPKKSPNVKIEKQTTLLSYGFIVVSMAWLSFIVRYISYDNPTFIITAAVLIFYILVGIGLARRMEIARSCILTMAILAVMALSPISLVSLMVVTTLPNAPLATYVLAILVLASLFSMVFYIVAGIFFERRSVKNLFK